MSSSSHSIEDDINYSDEDQMDESANTVTSDPVFESVTEMQIPEAEHAAATAKETEDQGHGIRVEKNVFYNDETIKYMRIIDTYKKLGVGKDIELPRVGSFYFLFFLNTSVLHRELLTSHSLLLRELKTAANLVCLKT
jgi:hypothetical protein